MQDDQLSDDDEAAVVPGMNSVTLLAFLAAFHVIRAPIGASSLALGLSEIGPRVSLISGTGDFLVGLVSVVVAWALKRRVGLCVWATALVWNTIGLADILNGQAIAALSVETAHMHLAPIIYLVPISLSAAHIASLWLLTRQSVIAAVVGQGMAPR